MLEGELVRTLFDIYRFSDKVLPTIIVESGTEFVWDDSTIDQNVDGLLVFVDKDEVELVNSKAPHAARITS